MFSHVQVDVLNSAVLILQKLEIKAQKVTCKDIIKIQQLMSRYEGKDYKHGKLNILQQTNITSYLYRIANQYDKSIEQIKSYRFLINPPPKISFFMNQLQLSEMYKRVKNNNNMYSSSYFKCDSDIQQGGMGVVEECKDENLNSFIQKGAKQNLSSLVLLMNEASMYQVLNHRNIQKLYDVHAADQKATISSNYFPKTILIKALEMGTQFKFYMLLYTQTHFAFYTAIQSLKILKNKDNIFWDQSSPFIRQLICCLGYTRMYCPFEISENKQCSLDADIYMIGKIIEILFINLLDEDLMKPQNGNFLISHRFKELLGSLINQEKANRPSLQILFKFFRYDVFIQKLYLTIIINSPVQNQMTYDEFSKNFYNQFYKFLDYKYQSYSLEKNSDHAWNINKFKEYGICSEQIIVEGLLKLLNSEDSYFIDCCLEKDIYTFIIELIKDSSKLDQKIIELQNTYNKEDQQCKTEIKLDSYNYNDEKPHHLGVFSDFQDYSAIKQQQIREILDEIYQQCKEEEELAEKLKLESPYQENAQIDIEEINLKIQDTNQKMINNKIIENLQQNYRSDKISQNRGVSMQMKTLSQPQQISKLSIQRNITIQEKHFKQPQVNTPSMENSKLQHSEFIQSQITQYGEDLDIEIVDIVSNGSNSTKSTYSNLSDSIAIND